ncbi:ISRSO17-transposase protein [Xanthomonas oryzae pv. oryzae KACC 10331]|uniref:ISRSO17-transposase protein n=1 Tax=Xanthomonas oryzae pv. oryzae (strain KACC10331 / KXO85) TaxID=291331 RepID=Q5GVX2_XANOR|nr:ISRSO17-transposase protein [Xanthomonas oryzae pv. oryzae KACC 10331]
MHCRSWQCRGQHFLSSTVLQIIVSLCHYWKTFRPRGRAVLNRSLEVRFEQYGEVVAAALSHADRKQPAHWYLKGLLLPGGRKSVEPMAARVHPQNVRSAHQSMHHLVADADWSDQALLAAVAAQVLPTLSRKSAACHWIVDDTGFSKKGGAFGRCCTPVLRPPWQDGQLPGCREFVDRQRTRQPASGLSAVSSRAVGSGHCAAQEGRRSGSGRVSDQDSAGHGSDRQRAGDRDCGRRRASRCGLRHRDPLARPAQRTRPAVTWLASAATRRSGGGSHQPAPMPPASPKNLFTIS